MPVYFIPPSDKEREKERVTVAASLHAAPPITKVNRKVYYEYIEDKGYYCN